MLDTPVEAARLPATRGPGPGPPREGSARAGHSQVRVRFMPGFPSPRSSRALPPRLCSLRQLCSCLLLLPALRASAFEARVLEQDEHSVTVRVLCDDLRAEPRETPGGMRVVPVSRGASVFQEGPVTWLSGPLSLAVPPGTRPSLRILSERVGAEAWPPPAALSERDTLAVPTGAPERPGLRLLDLGWQRSQKVQRLAVDLAVHHDGWRRLEALDFVLDFLPDAAEQARLALSDHEDARPWRESPIFERQLARQVLNHEQARAWRVDPRRLSAHPQSLRDINPALEDDWITRIMVDQDGLVKVGEADLHQAGVDTDAIDPATLSLWEGGHEVPLLMQDGSDGSLDPGDYFVFAGRQRRGEFFPQSFFGPENAYFLTWGHGTGRRFVDLSAAPLEDQPIVRSYRLLEHMESNRYWVSLEDETSDPVHSDHWQWRNFSAINSPANFSLDVPLDNPLGGEDDQTDHVRFAIRGSSLNQTTGSDHHAVVRLDGQWIGDLETSRQQEGVSSWFPLAPGQLAGRASASLDFELPLDRGEDSDVFYLNWLDLDYLRALNIRSDGQLQLPAAQVAGRNLQVAGLEESNPLLLSEDGWHLLGGRPVEGLPGHLRFWSGELQADLFISDFTQLKPPARIVRHANAHLRDADNQADMLIMAPAQYLPALEDLAQYHGQSMSVKLVDIESVYSEFSRGLMDTQAMQDFLTTTFSTWQTPSPIYLTLVGKASRANDLKLEYEPRYRTQVPTWWVQTFTSGATASDENFTYLVGADTLWSNPQHASFEVRPDTFQDLMVGRISVYSVDQLQAFLAKHREYRELSYPGPWMETQVMAADRGNEQAFEVGNALVEQILIPEAYPVADIHVRSDSPYHGGALDFIDLFNAGCTVLNYNGHGAIGILSSSSLFRATDIRFLSNRGKYPISFAWSCLVGYFDDPDSSSMAELLIRKANAGSIACYVSTAKATLSVDNPLMTHYFYNQYDPAALTLGEIVQLTENTLLLTPNTADIIHMYNLQGDPALVPAFPRQRLLPAPVVLALDTGEAASFSLSTEPPGLSGTLEITFQPHANRPANFQGAERRTWTQAFTDGQTVTVQLPAIDVARKARLLLAMTTASGRAVGALPLFLNLPFAGMGSHSPYRGLAGAPLDFSFQSPLAVDSVRIMTNFVTDSLAMLRMTPLGGGAFARRITSLPGFRSSVYRQLTPEWLADWEIDVPDWPSFQLHGLICRYRVYDGESYTDADANGHFDAGEDYQDENANGQWDPPGEPFNDENGDGIWQPGEAFQDLNNDNVRQAWIDLPGAFVSVLESESISAQDTLITVAAGSSGLEAALRWTISASQPLDGADLRLSRLEADTSWSTLWNGRVTAQAGSQAFRQAVGLAPGPQRLRFAAGPLWLGQEQLVGVDSLVLADAFTLLTPAAGSAGDLGLDAGGYWTLNVPAGSLQTPVQLDPAGLAQGLNLRTEGQGQPGLGLLQATAADSLLQALELGPRAAERPAADLHPTGATLSCRFSQGRRFSFPDAVLGDTLPLALARWVPERGLWVVQPGRQSAMSGSWLLLAELALRGGRLWPVALRDQAGPALAAQVSGQWFGDGDVVAREPVFQFHLEDVDGIDLGEGRSAPLLTLDGAPVPAEQIQVGEGVTGLVLQYSPGALEPASQHELTLQAWDALGNATALATTFRVATNLALEFFANHPNPFQGETTFAWQLSNLPRSLRFEIYTASGRLVRRIRIPSPRIGYDEYVWDGRDQEGRDVANGVYFLRVVAGGNGALDEIYKLARLR